jgi:hypothetical protein
MSHFLVRFHLNLFIISVFEKRMKGGSPLRSPFQNAQHHHKHEIKAVGSSRTAINTTFQNGRSSRPLPPHSQCWQRHCCPLVWTPSTAINYTAINDAHSTIAIHPFLPLRLLKPPTTSSHSPFHPLLIALLPMKRQPPLRPSHRLASELRHASLRIHKFARPPRCHCCQPNSSLTAATPILAFLLALDRLTFKGIPA